MNELLLNANFRTRLLPFASASTIELLVPLRLTGSHNRSGTSYGDARSFDEGVQGSLNGTYGVVDLVTEHLAYLEENHRRTTRIVLRSMDNHLFDEASTTRLEELLAVLHADASKLVRVFAGQLEAVKSAGVQGDVMTAYPFTVTDDTLEQFFEAAQGKDLFGGGFWFGIRP